MNKYILK